MELADTDAAQASPAEERERSIALESAVNVRDIGGYPTEHGWTRWGLVFRADNVSYLTEADIETVGALGIATVVDLRTSFEVELGTFPHTRLPVNLHHLPLLDELPDPERFKMAPGMLATQYEEIIDQAAAQIGRALGVLASAGALPSLVHCTAGKDRTGILIALLLSLLGVDDEVVVADYALSAEAMGRLRAALVARYPEGKEVIESADEMFSAAPDTMVQLLETLRTRYGSVEAYAEAAGAGPEVVATLRRRLVEPTA